MIGEIKDPAGGSVGLASCLTAESGRCLKGTSGYIVPSNAKRKYGQACKSPFDRPGNKDKTTDYRALVVESSRLPAGVREKVASQRQHREQQGAPQLRLLEVQCSI
jgi:hypothetical protein